MSSNANVISSNPAYLAYSGNGIVDSQVESREWSPIHFRKPTATWRDEIALG